LEPLGLRGQVFWPNPSCPQLSTSRFTPVTAASCMALIVEHVTCVTVAFRQNNKDSFIPHSNLHQFHSNKGQNIPLGISIETTATILLQKSHICHHLPCTLTIVPENAYLCDILNYCKGSASPNHTRLCTNIDISSLHPTKNHHHDWT
jgi:hypothetical protein